MSPARSLAGELLLGLERWAPFARPYNLDDHYDCWGFLRQVYGSLDPRIDVDARLSGSDEAWASIEAPDDLTIGDLLVTHRSHPGEDGGFHAVMYCGRVDDRHLVYDSSPRGSVPVFEEVGGGGAGKAGPAAAQSAWRFTGERSLHTRYQRATESTTRLRDAGGAYLRSWHPDMAFYDRALHELLLAEGACRDLASARLAAGLSPLPFYARGHLPRAWSGAETYDNRLTRFTGYYSPGGAPVCDDDYGLVLAGDDRAPLGRRPAAPLLVAPHGGAQGGDVVLRWRRPALTLGGGPCGPIDAWRVEVWKELPGVWKRFVLRRDLDGPEEGCVLGAGDLDDDTKYAVSVFARQAGGEWSTDAAATFVCRPAAGNPFLSENTVRPFGLAPDWFDVVPTTTPLLRWRILDAGRHLTAWRLQVLEGGPSGSGASCVHEARGEGAAAGTAYAVPAAAGLRDGHTYHWYLSTCDAAGNWTYAPVEGVFVVDASAGTGA